MALSFNDIFFRINGISHQLTAADSKIRAVQRVGRRDLYLLTHNTQTDIHASGGIRTSNPSKRSAADPRLGPCGHWDRQCLGL